MIGKVTRGESLSDLLRYLYGPGRHNEYRDPHIVAGFRAPASLEPRLRPNGRRDFRHLIDVLEASLRALRTEPPTGPVWQCSIRAASGDRTLSDEEWADIAEEVMDRTGIAPRGDDRACRWIAVRHADDHIHLVATLARQDRRRPNIWRDFFRVREACQEVEERYRLTPTAPADRTAAARPTRAEQEQAQRKGWEEPPRKTLRREVAAAAAGAGTEEEFFARLAGAGLLVRRRMSVRNPGEVTGYAVALPGHTNGEGKPVWFSGGKLAPDLTIPKLRHRWTGGPEPHSAGRSGAHQTTVRMVRGSSGPPGLSLEERADAYRQAIRAVDAAAQQMRWSTDPRVRADLAVAASDVLHVTAVATGNRHLARAADFFGRATREPFGEVPARTQYGIPLRTAARILALSCVDPAGRRDRVTAVAAETMRLIASLISLVEAVAEFREAQYRPAQANAARATAERLRGIDSLEPASMATQLPTFIEQNAAQLAAENFPIPVRRVLRDADRSQSIPSAPHQNQPRPRGPTR